MKKLYSIMLSALVIAVPAMAAQSTSGRTDKTLADYSGEYAWSYTALGKYDNIPSLTITVTDESTGAATISGLPNNFKIKATFDLTAGTLSIPNMQDLGRDAWGENIFYIKTLNENNEEVAGASDAAATVGKISGGTITFPRNDIWAIGDPENEQSFWHKCYLNILTLNESGYSDEGWTSLGDATFQDGWVLTMPVYGLDQTAAENRYKVELQQNDENKSLYRLVDPYHGNCPVAQYNPVEKVGYIEFDVTDPDHVVFNTKVSAGFSAVEIGLPDTYCYNYTSYVMAKFGYSLQEAVAAIMQEDETYRFSTFKDGVLIVPSWTDGEGNIKNDACCSSSAAPANYTWRKTDGVTFANMEAKIIFPGSEEGSIADINAADETSDVYYDLRGRRIARPTAPGLYICNNAKILVR